MEENKKSNEKRRRVPSKKPTKKAVKAKVEKNENEGTPIRKNQIIKKQNTLPKETKNTWNKKLLLWKIPVEINLKKKI